MVSRVIFLVTFGFLAASAAVLEHDGDEGPLSNNCVKCLREVIGSDSENCAFTRCGPMQISMAQWQNAYNIRTTEEQAFADCAFNSWCALRTVQDYMTKNLPLCVRRTPSTDSFRSVCESALILHVNGETSCQNPSNTGVIQENRDDILECLNRRSAAWLAEGQEDDDTNTETDTDQQSRLAKNNIFENIYKESLQENQSNKQDYNVLNILNGV